MSLIIHFFQEKNLPDPIIYLVISYIGNYLPHFQNKILLKNHFAKRYCHHCGEYLSFFSRKHIHRLNQKYFKYRTKYSVYLRIHKFFHISKTNNCFTPKTPNDMIVVWQNTKTHYFTFRQCINNPRKKRLKSHRDVYFTDIAILSLAKFWFIDEWNLLYPNMKFIHKNDDYVITDFHRHIDFLWTPNLSD